MRVRRLARAADDGYESPLVPGLRATADAELLAEELAFSAARLTELHGDAPPGLYGEAARLGREGALDEALWLTFDDRVRRPAGGAGRRVRARSSACGCRGTPARSRRSRTWRSARAASPTRRAPSGALAAYRGWAARGGGQAAALAGEPSWTPERRFDRAFERLALPGLGRAQRYEFLLTAGALGLADVRAAALHLLGDAARPDRASPPSACSASATCCSSRAAPSELASACALPPAALDLALVNWAPLHGRPRRRADQLRQRRRAGP